jgi:formamidopyrimidine-DNA glycosylase
MPELPDVEGFRRYFEQTALNKKIVETDLSAPKMLKEIDPEDFVIHTEGYKFISASRHGKYLFAGLNNGKYLMLHFGMTGYLVYFKDEEEASSYIYLKFKLSNGFYIAYDNRRKFGAIMLLDNMEEFISSKGLGTDPLKGKFTLSDYLKLTEGKTGSLKSLLMDQSVIAGIGNLYSDEIAYQAGIHPSASFSTLNADKKKLIYRKMMSILKAAVKKDGELSALPDKYLLNHRKEGDKCPICGGNIIHKTIAGRTSYFCKNHQRM